MLAPVSVARAGENASAGSSFTVAPVISDIQVSDVTTSAATIGWKTNGTATSQVFHDTEFHENTVGYAYHTDEDTPLVSEHSVGLTGLSSGTTYHFRVRSVVNGGEVISNDYTFTTRPTAAPPPPVPPRYNTDIDFFGETSKWPISYDGRLLEPVEITSKEGKTNVYIPKDTLCLDKERNRLKGLVMKVAEKTPGPAKDYVVVSKVYNFGPGGATFDPYLKLTLAYEEKDIPEEVKEEELYIAYYSSEWVPLKSVVDAQGNKVSTELTHLTVFAIMAKLPPPPPPPPAEFVLSNLEVDPAEVEPGKEVTVTIEVKNIGGREGSYLVSLRINGVLEKMKKVILAPNALKLTIFAVTKDEPGIYSVDVNGLKSSFTVKEKSVPEEPVVPPVIPKPTTWRLIGGVVVTGLLIFFLVFRQRRRDKESPK